MKRVAFKAWLVVDREGTYSPTMHITRNEAAAHRQEHSHLIDAKWVIVRVQVRELPQEERKIP